MASILDSPHIHKRRWRGGDGDAAHTRGEERETMMMMMHMAKISPRGALQAAAATAAATGRRRAALAITVLIR